MTIENKAKCKNSNVKKECCAEGPQLWLFINQSCFCKCLDRIYQKMASSVIDVAPGESIIIQQAEFLERQRIYQMKLGQIKMSLPLRLNNQIPKQVDKGQEKRRVEYEPISNEDKQLIIDISEKSAQAIKNFKLDSDEQIISQFMA